MSWFNRATPIYQTTPIDERVESAVDDVCDAVSELKANKIRVLVGDGELRIETSDQSQKGLIEDIINQHHLTFRRR